MDAGALIQSVSDAYIRYGTWGILGEEWVFQNT